MAKIDVRNWKGEVVGSVELDDAVASYPLKEHLIWEAVQAYRAAARAGTHATKNRSHGADHPWSTAGPSDNASPVPIGPPTMPASRSRSSSSSE